MITNCIISPTAPGVWPVLDSGVYGIKLGNMTTFSIIVWWENSDDGRILHLAVKGRGAYQFHMPAHPSYVKAKLGVPYDAENMADFINCQLGYDKIPKMGNYN